MSNMTVRDQLRQTVGRVYVDSLAWKFWSRAGRMLAWLPGVRGSQAPFWLTSLAAFVLADLVCALFALGIGASNFFSPKNLSYIFLTTGWIWLSVNLGEWQVRRNIRAIQEDLLEILKLPDGRQTLSEWLGRIANRKNQIISVLLAYVFLLIPLLISQEFDISRPLDRVLILHGVLRLGLWIFHFVWLMILIQFYAWHLARLPLALFPDNPSSTPALQSLHRRSGQLLLVAALISALAIPVGLFADRLTTLLLWMAAFLLWIPLLAFFVATENSFAYHIRSTKNERLYRLQNRIAQLADDKKLPEAGKVALEKGILELHEHIHRTPNTLVNILSLLNLFGSLALPLIGALLNILDIWKKLFPSP